MTELSLLLVELTACTGLMVFHICVLKAWVLTRYSSGWPTEGEFLDINGRIGLALLTWLVVAALTSMLIGQERKRRWFRLRDPSKSFLNRRGFLGDFINFGFPRTREGWAVFSAFIIMILVSGYIITVE